MTLETVDFVKCRLLGPNMLCEVMVHVKFCIITLHQ
jgi:hypothetical protein